MIRSAVGLLCNNTRVRYGLDGVILPIYLLLFRSHSHVVSSEYDLYQLTHPRIASLYYNPGRVCAT